MEATTSNSNPSTPTKKGQEEDNAYTRHEFFMGVADLARFKSSDPNTKVGCVLVRSDTRQILSIGYNGLVQGLENTVDIWREDSKDNYLQHAEANALHFCNVNDPEVPITAYVTMFPCKECALSLIQRRVECVIYNVTREKYFSKSYKFFEEAKVRVCSINNLKKDAVLNADYNLRNTHIKGDFVAITEFYNKSIERPETSKNTKGQGSVIVGVPEKLVYKWDHLFMGVAHLALRRSKEGKGEACCIVKKNRILGYGYYGSPQLLARGENATDSERDGIKNGISFAGNIKGSVVYSTHFPSMNAFLELLQRKVRIVYYYEDPSPSQNVDKIMELAQYYNVGLMKWKAYDILAKSISWKSLNNAEDVLNTYGLCEGDNQLYQKMGLEDTVKDIQEWVKSTSDSVKKSAEKAKKSSSGNRSASPLVFNMEEQHSPYKERKQK